jgi:hypothetical protein
VPGSLAGPFDGRVVDAESGRPIAGALVYATWTLQSGFGLPTPAGAREHVTSTDADGRYRIPRLALAPRQRGYRLTDFSLVVYKRGYVAYRSDRRFEDLGLRLDFAQRAHVVVLDKWRADHSHAKHLRYLGGGAALASLTAWEIDEAARELAGAPAEAAPLASTPLLAVTDPGGAAAVVAARLLTAADITGVTGFQGDFETGPLGDEPDNESYSSIHLRALDRAETFDVALRLWKLGAAEAQRRYGQLLESLPGAIERNEIADRSLRAAEGEIRGVAFLDGRRGVVVLLTCGVAQCRTPQDAATIAARVYERLVAVWPTVGR